MKRVPAGRSVLALRRWRKGQKVTESENELEWIKMKKMKNERGSAGLRPDFGDFGWNQLDFGPFHV